MVAWTCLQYTNNIELLMELFCPSVLCSKKCNAIVFCVCVKLCIAWFFQRHQIKSQNAQSSLNYKTLGHAILTHQSASNYDKLYGLYSDFIWGLSGRNVAACCWLNTVAVCKMQIEFALLAF